MPSGLQYKVLKGGSGKIPTASDTVPVHYRGTLIGQKIGARTIFHFRIRKRQDEVQQEVDMKMSLNEKRS